MSNLLDEPVKLRSDDYEANYSEGPIDPEDGNHGVPRVFLDNPCIAELPEEGLITFRYKRGPKTIREASKHGPATASAEFFLHEIRSCEECEDEESTEDGAPDSALDSLFESLEKR